MIVAVVLPLASVQTLLKVVAPVNSQEFVKCV
jgi:hypothetical protein